MDHASASLTVIDNGSMTPLLGPMGVGHLRRKRWGGVGLRVADVIEGHWLQKAAMGHQRAALVAKGGGGAGARDRASSDGLAEDGVKRENQPRSFQRKIVEA